MREMARKRLQALKVQAIELPRIVVLAIGIVIGGIGVLFVVNFSASVLQLPQALRDWTRTDSLQALVAVGTLSLAIVTGYVTIRDRREALRRELADKIYVPMRQEAIDWQNPESQWHPPSWAVLIRTVPYLTMRIRDPLRVLFERELEIERQISIYDRAVYDFIQSQSLGAVGTPTLIGIRKGNEHFPDVMMTNVWKSGMTPEKYVESYMAHNYPLVKEWELDLWADVPSPSGTGTKRQQIGGTKESIEYMNKLYNFLESKHEAVYYRDRYMERVEVGEEAFKRIEKELRKPVASHASS
jgi:hypothetical protein